MATELTGAPGLAGAPGLDVVIGLDLGTTSVKALALDAAGTVLARSAGGYALHSGADGSATQDAGEVVRAALGVLDALAARLPGVVFRALVPSAAMHSLVLIGAAGEMLAPALTWADTRPAVTLPGLRSVLDPAETYARSGCPVQAPYHQARLWWLRQRRPELLARTARFVSLTDLVLHRLTGPRWVGRWATSVGLASTTGLWNLHTGRWDTAILEALGISEGQLPAVLDAREVVGTVQAGTGQAGMVQAGPLTGTPVLAGSSDGALANLGAGALPGEVVITVGTSGALRRLSGQARLDPQARTWRYRLDLATHLSGGAINNGGLLLDWVRRSWYSELDAAEGFGRLLADAAEVPAGAEGLTLLPYRTGERSPLWRSDLSATLHGLRLAHGRAQVARSALEAVAFSLGQLWAMGAGSGTVFSTGELAAHPAWNQLLADVLGVPVRVSEGADASAIGAALLGHRETVLEELRSRAGSGRLVLPDPRHAGPLRGVRQRWEELSGRLYGP